jgi:hypothetical protein
VLGEPREQAWGQLLTGIVAAGKGEDDDLLIALGAEAPIGTQERASERQACY